MPDRPRNYTVAEVADILRITVYYANQLCREGKIPGAHKPLGQRLVDRETFDAWYAEASTKAAS